MLAALARARGWAARCHLICSSCRGGDGARAVGGSMMMMMTSASPVRGRRGFDAGRAQRDLRGHRQRSPNSAALTLGRSALLSPGCARRCSEQSAEFGRVNPSRSPYARARGWAARCHMNLLDPLDRPGRCGGSRPAAIIMKKKSATAIRDRRWSSVISTTCPGRRCGCRPTSTSSF